MTVRWVTVGPLGTQCYLVWEDPAHAVVIDPGDEALRILEAVKANGLTVDAVLLTHAHFDHMLAARAVCDGCRAPLWVPAGDAPALTDAGRNLSGWVTLEQPLFLEADRLLSEGEKMTFGSMVLTLWETPGHTPGSACYVGGNTVFSGDTLFFGSVGRMDFPGGDPEAMKRSLMRLMQLPPETLVYPGHGESTTIGFEKVSNPYVREE